MGGAAEYNEEHSCKKGGAADKGEGLLNKGINCCYWGGAAD